MKLIKPNEVMQKLREEMGLTQAEIAEKLGMPQSSYAMIESGHRPHPRREVQKKIADFFGKTVDELFFADLNHGM